MAAAVAWLGIAQDLGANDEAAATRDPRAHFFAQTFGDLPEELVDAREAGKAGLLLFFEQSGCAYCEKMMNTVFNQPRVQEWYREHFVVIAVDIRGDVELTDVDGITLPSKVFAEHRKVKYTPVLSFLDLNGVEVYRKSGMVADPDVFLLMGRYFVEQRYTDTPFRDYLAEHGGGEEGKILRTPAAVDGPGGEN